MIGRLTGRQNVGDGFFSNLSDNPILVREIRARAGSWSMPLAMAAYATALGGFALVMFAVTIARAPGGDPSPADMADVAFLTLCLQLLLHMLIVPPLVADSMAGERERGTLETLLTGVFDARNVVRFKLLAAVGFPLLLLVVGLPVLLAVFAYAGAGVWSLIVGELVTAVAVVAIGAVAIAAGATAPRALSATFITYAAVAALFVVLGLLGALLHHGSDRAVAESVHPLAFVNPFYVFHALVLGPSPAGLDVGHLVGLLFQRHATTSTWGPTIQPWTASVPALAVVVAIGLGSASRAVLHQRFKEGRIWRLLTRPVVLPGSGGTGSGSDGSDGASAATGPATGAAAGGNPSPTSVAPEPSPG